jgi:transcriptional regulator with XRE-family HTH domain
MAAVERFSPNIRAGRAIAERRRALGLTQREAAELVGVTRSLLAQWESGRRAIGGAGEGSVLAALADGATDASARRETARERDLRDAIQRVVDERAGLTRGELSKALRRPQGLDAALSALLGDGGLHERWHEPPASERGRIRRRLGLFPGVAREAEETPTFGEHEIRAARKALGLTQLDLACRLGVDQSFVARWEAGERHVPERHQHNLTAELRPSGESLRQWRDRLKWTQRKFAEEASVSLVTAGRWERGDQQVPLARWLAIAKRLESATIEAEPDPVAAMATVIVEAVRAQPGKSRTYFLKRFRSSRTGPAIDSALATGEIHERAVVRDDRRRGQGHNRRMAGRGLFPGEAAAGEHEPRMSGRELREARARLGWSQGNVARRLGVEPITVASWERPGRWVPAGRAESLRLEISKSSRVPDTTRTAVLRKKVLLAIKAQPGIDRWEVSRRSQVAREGGLVGRAIAALLDDRVVHERPVPARPGRTRLGLFAGPAPPEHDPREPLAAAELVRLRRAAGLSQRALAERLGVDRGWIGQWETSAAPIPAGRRGQIRAAIAAPATEAALPPAPAFDGDELRCARVTCGWSQGDLARRIGVTQSTISAWETNGRPIPPDVRPGLREILRARPAAKPPSTGVRLRQARQRAGISQRALAGQLGVQQSSVSQWELGYLVPDDARLEAALGLLEHAA